jgi:hypothetical protein
VPRVVHAFGELDESRGRWHRAAAEQLAIRCEKRDARPLAEPEPRGEVRPPLRVNPDRHEARVQQRGERCMVGERPVQVGARRRPSRVEKDGERLVVRARARARGAAPLEPGNRGVDACGRRAHRNASIIMTGCSRSDTRICWP